MPLGTHNEECRKISVFDFLQTSIFIRYPIPEHNRFECKTTMLVEHDDLHSISHSISSPHGQVCNGLNFCLNRLRSVSPKFESTQLMPQAVCENRDSIQLMIQAVSEVSASIQLMIQAKII